MNIDNHISKPHSAEYFGDTRDFWWNSDFLELMGKRLQFGNMKKILDVGCGVGHWGRLLALFYHQMLLLWDRSW
jgi:ubiquinone/menaquinone biosynthesis C-methylase UbiE